MKTKRKLDPVHFSLRPWGRRVREWLRRAQSAEQPRPFLDGNAERIRNMLSDPETGVRVVINIGPDALLAFLRSGLYKNLYAEPVVGGKRRKPNADRMRVDYELLELDGPNTYFGAVALGGAGVRFYGEYCMALRRNRVTPDTGLFDRDSYDLLLPPLTGWSQARTKRIVNSLKGQWLTDVVDMLVMKLLPRLPDAQHLITTGNVSRLVMSDQEFVEVQMAGPVNTGHVEEVLYAPEDAAVEAWVLGRARMRELPSLVELRWAAQRQRVAMALARQGLPRRVAGHHGRGYQWA